jgi:hypothetical protein
VGIGDRITLLARRTTRPYRVLGRTVVGLIGALAVLFLLLVLLRVAIMPTDCPDAAVTTATGQLVHVRLACKSDTWMQSFGASVIDNLAAGLIVVSVSTFMLWLVSPKEQVEEDIAALEPWNIREALNAPLAYTKNYWFRGRSGRFIRSSVMPALFQAGARDSQLRRLFMLLPDPGEIDTLSSYAHYRNSLASETRQWTVASIQSEIIATILTAARLSQKSRFFAAKVYLKSDFALFRLDMSDDRMVMTREDPKWPAIICSSRSKFYASYHEEFRNEAENGKELDLEKIRLEDDIDAQQVNDLVAAVGISIQLSEADCQSVIDAMNKPKLPYG